MAEAQHTYIKQPRPQSANSLDLAKQPAAIALISHLMQMSVSRGYVETLPNKVQITTRWVAKHCTRPCARPYSGVRALAGVRARPYVVNSESAKFGTQTN